MYNNFGENMNSIDKNIKNEIIINKSRFITCLFKINNKNDIEQLIEQIKTEYKDATHYCYAYIIDGNMRCSDDGEPSNTAGTPLLNVLKKNNLEHILVIVIRYFGGIKLGKGGLVRAYTKSITECLNLINIIELNNGYLIKIEFNHSNIKQIDYILKNIDIIKSFENIITYKFYLKDIQLNDIKQKLEKYILNFEIIEKLYI